MVVGQNGDRRNPISDFLVDILTTSLEATEIVREIRVPTPPAGHGAAYAKAANKASHFAIVGAAALVRSKADGDVAIGITGMASKAFRASAVEEALRGRELTADTSREAAGRAAEGGEPQGDLHASAEYRRHLAGVMTRRALEQALSRAS